MTSNNLSSCCYTGVKHEGDPRGRHETVADFQAYIIEPEKPNGFGIILYTVIMPDLFFGDPVPLNADMASFNLPEWMQGKLHPKGIAHVPETVDPIVAASLKLLREKYRVQGIAAVGYCFGAKYAVRALGFGGVDAAYIAHPAMITPEELSAVKGPLALAAAESDNIFPTPLRHESEALLQKLDIPYQINLYSGVNHGFAIRCDLSVKRQRLAKESAFLFALQWFDQYLNK
ncbi:Alpha/Beta hydrolase protein [Leptodontidium sp. MPI-SDFR-AT-0119]|nr:Alpha/Beta hydrolase protein [Leptodontidium sp. MPI-SDFR-AT-0119]